MYLGMVYAMFSIGLLGFLVWSQSLFSMIEMVALFYRETEVTNFAICWNSFMLFGTFYGKNLNSYTQPAGHRNYSHTSSSETRCETSRSHNFTLFKNIYSAIGFTNNISNNWLSWFVGFAEGDGALLSSKGRLQFVLTQKESSILEHIRNVLGFGTVRKFTSGKSVFHRYVVEDYKGVLLLSLIFNGNLAILFFSKEKKKHRVSQLEKWLVDINKKTY